LIATWIRAALASIWRNNFLASFKADSHPVSRLDLLCDIVSNVIVMVRNKYEGDLAEAEAKLQKMLSDLDLLQTKIAKQKRVVAALRELADVADDADGPTDLVVGITDACRTVLRAADRPMLPVEVRDQIQALGIQQDNLLASVHTILKRLVKSDEVREKYIKSGYDKGETPVRYQWVSHLERTLVPNSALAALSGDPELFPKSSLAGLSEKQLEAVSKAMRDESIGERFLRAARAARERQAEKKK
jgi:hypothetical protein